MPPPQQNGPFIRPLRSCCSFSLQTGITIIGWLEFICSSFLIVYSVKVIERVEHVANLPLYNITIEDTAVLHQLQEYKRIPVLRFTLIAGLIYQIITWGLSCILLFGAYQRSIIAVLIWVFSVVTLHLLAFMVNMIMLVFFSQSYTWLEVVSKLFVLLCTGFFICVVYSFYIMLQETEKYRPKKREKENTCV